MMSPEMNSGHLQKAAGMEAFRRLCNPFHGRLAFPDQPCPALVFDEYLM
jgi:hypothetical protein